MRKLRIVVALILFAGNISAQNMVLDPSFSSCKKKCKSKWKKFEGKHELDVQGGMSFSSSAGKNTKIYGNFKGTLKDSSFYEVRLSVEKTDTIFFDKASFGALLCTKKELKQFKKKNILLLPQLITRERKRKLQDGYAIYSCDVFVSNSSSTNIIVGFFPEKLYAHSVIPKLTVKKVEVSKKIIEIDNLLINGNFNIVDKFPTSSQSAISHSHNWNNLTSIIIQSDVENQIELNINTGQLNRLSETSKYLGSADLYAVRDEELKLQDGCIDTVKSGLHGLFAGINLYAKKNNFGCEYLQGRLTRKLEKGETVEGTIKYRLTTCSKFLVDHLSVLFTPNEVVKEKEGCNTPIKHDNSIDFEMSVASFNTNEWKNINFSYIANGDEQFLTIGYISNDQSSNTTYMGKGKNSPNSYFLFDDIIIKGNGVCPKDRGSKN